MGRPLGALSLRSAIQQRLAADPTLVTALGGTRFHAEATAAMVAPYLTLRVTESHPAGGNGLDVEAHTLLIDVASRRATGAELYWISARVSWLLNPANLTLGGHRLMYLGLLDSKASRDGDLRRAQLTFRALTMPDAPAVRKAERGVLKAPRTARPAVTEPIAVS